MDIIIGNIRFISDELDDINSTIIIITTVISIALTILTMIIILKVLKCLKTYTHCRSSPSDKEKPSTNKPVSMYTSPPYSTRVFAEPGLDHVYDSIDDDEMTTALQDTTCTADDEVDADGYLRMRSYSEGGNQTIVEGSESNSNTQQAAVISNPQPVNGGMTQMGEFYNVLKFSGKVILV